MKLDYLKLLCHDHFNNDEFIIDERFKGKMNMKDMNLKQPD
jgi:hypothetical protein